MVLVDVVVRRKGISGPSADDMWGGLFLGGGMITSRIRRGICGRLSLSKGRVCPTR